MIEQIEMERERESGPGEETRKVNGSQSLEQEESNRQRPRSEIFALFLPFSNADTKNKESEEDVKMRERE